MSGAREIAAVIDFPVIETDSRNSFAKVTRSKSRPPMHENAWTAQLMARYEGWHDLLGLASAQNISLETTLTPGKNRLPRRGSGLCRMDAFVTHFDGSITIVESKVSGNPIEICGAIGQLIYYKTLAEIYWGVEVSALVLASRFLPEFVLDAIANVKAPIRLLKVTDDGSFYGLVPDYGSIQ